MERYKYQCCTQARSAGEQQLSSLRLGSKKVLLYSSSAAAYLFRNLCALCVSCFSARLVLISPGGTPGVASLQPLESAEFRLRVSNSVEPSAMYAKTLEATEVSPYSKVLKSFGCVIPYEKHHVLLFQC